MYFKQFFDPKLAQYSYLIGCQQNGEAIVIDPMRDIDRYIQTAANENLSVVAAADTHIHADYLSGLREFAERGVKIYASDEGDDEWKYEWLQGSGYDHQLLLDGDEIRLGNITIRAWHTPGHTPEHLSYLIIDGARSEEPMGIITGDFVFVGDVGRPDLLETAAGQIGVMKSSAETLYGSIKAFEKLPDYLQVWPGHGSGSACGKALGAVPESTTGYELRYNPSLKAAAGQEEFVRFILSDQPEPPLYFARMKHENKVGAAILGSLPRPARLTFRELDQLAGNQQITFLDTRSRKKYADGHLPGSLLAPLDKQFNTVAGSYLEANSDIYLVTEEAQINEAVTDLIRIGLDRIRGYVTEKDLQQYAARGGQLETMKIIDFEAVEREAGRGDTAVLDVRTASEYHQFHLPDAIHIPHTRLADQLNSVPKGKKLLVHCQTGARSAVAASLLKHHGFDVTMVDDQIETYREKAVSGT